MGDDLGFSFFELLWCLGSDPFFVGLVDLVVFYVIICVVVRFVDGVVMVGDCWVIFGNLISYCIMEKVCEVDCYSGVVIVGAVGLVMEMVKLF